MADEMIVEVPEEGETQPEPKEEKQRNEKGQFVAKNDGVDELRAQLEAKTRSEAEARQQAQERDAEAKKQAKAAEDATAKLTEVRKTALTADISAVDASIKAAQTEADQAQAQQQAAFESGDFKAASEAGRKMAAAESRLQRLQEGKADLELRAAEEAKRPAKEPETITPQGDVAKPHPKAQAWLNAHPEYMTDQKKMAKATSAHWAAVSEGLTPDQDEYYPFVEEFLGLKEPKKEPKVDPKETKAGDKQFSAPVTREGAPSAGASGTKVTLTPGEVANATDGTITWQRDDPAKGIKKGTPIGVAEMARRKLAMQKEGRYMNQSTDA